MKTICAFNSSITPSLIRAVTTGYELAKCRIHPAQLSAFENLAIYVREIIIEQIKDGYPMPEVLRSPAMLTIAGVPVDLDLEFPMSKIQFLDADGIAVTEIDSLAIPVAFA